MKRSVVLILFFVIVLSMCMGCKKNGKRLQGKKNQGHATDVRNLKKKEYEVKDTSETGIKDDSLQQDLDTQEPPSWNINSSTETPTNQNEQGESTDKDQKDKPESGSKEEGKDEKEKKEKRGQESAPQGPKGGRDNSQYNVDQSGGTVTQDGTVK